MCVPCETDESAPLCDNNDVTHKNKCEYNYQVCLAQEEPGIKHYGGCKRKSLLVREYLTIKYQDINKVFLSNLDNYNINIFQLTPITLLVN